ncbi:protein turtle homolog B-like [Haemaphysalis longicornis]
MLIQWFKEGDHKPIYEYQVAPHTEGTWLENVHQKLPHHHRPRPDWLGRAFFRGGHEDSPALTVTKLTRRDQGTYTCKIAFGDGAARTLATSLLIVGTTNQPSIFDEKGRELGQLAGPYMEGDSMTLTCEARKDFRLSWYWNSAPTIDRPHHRGQPSESVLSRSKLTRHNLSRKDRGAQIACVATNALGAIVNTTVTLDLWTPASSVRIGARPFKDGVPASVECEVVGSRPAPLVTWYVGDAGPLDATFTHVQAHADVATSVLTLTVHSKDRGKAITCVVAHPLADVRLNASFVIDVHYKPVLRLTANASIVDHQDGLSLECEVDANPPAREVSWHLKGRLIRLSQVFELENGVVPLTRAHLNGDDAGAYQCRAWNSCGSSGSNMVSVTVAGGYGSSPLRSAGFLVTSIFTLLSTTCRVDGL